MSYRSKQMLIVRRDLKMRKGKIAAQASHASVEAVLKAIVKENRAGQLRTDPEGYAYLDAPEGQESPLTDWFRYGMAWQRSASMWILRRNCWRWIKRPGRLT